MFFLHPFSVPVSVSVGKEERGIVIDVEALMLELMMRLAKCKCVMEQNSLYLTLNLFCKREIYLF